MEFSIVIITRNEEKNLQHLYQELKPFMNAGGEVVIVDTGSTDKTVSKACSLGFTVRYYTKKLIRTMSDDQISSIKSYLNSKDVEDDYVEKNLSRTFFDFAEARNHGHNYASKNMILYLDASHYILAFDFKTINSIIRKDKAQRFTYRAYYANEGSSGLGQINDIDRFYNRNIFEWKQYVHECLQDKGKFKWEMKYLNDKQLLLRHLRNANKTRNYLSGMFCYFLDYKTPRIIYYLGRELYYLGFYNSAINILTEYEKFKVNEVWANEYSAALSLIGECHQYTNNYEKAEEYFTKAIAMFSKWREPYMKLGRLYLDKKEYVKCIQIAQEGLKITKEDVFTEISENYSYVPHDLIIRACYHLTENPEYIEMGKKHVKQCLNFNFNNAFFKSMQQYFNNFSSSFKQPVVVIYLSYSPLTNGPIYGSELAAVKLAECMVKKGVRVYVLNFDQQKRINNGVIYMNCCDFQQTKPNVDVLIISRYINYYIEFDYKPKKTFLWMHDVNLCPYYDGKCLKDMGYYLLLHTLEKMEKVIALTEWHVDCIIREYNFIPRDKIQIIGNGITTSLFQNLPETIPNRFIYVSAFNRGLDKLVDYFHEIVKEFPDAELHVFRDYKGYEALVESWKQYPYIHCYGRVDNTKIIEEFGKADIWFYPTAWEETYCISALEAQMTNTLCICTDLAALKNVVSNRGFLFGKEVRDNKTKCVEYVLNIMRNRKLIEFTKNKAREWAINQDWMNRCEEWLKLMNIEYTDDVEEFMFFPNLDCFGEDLKHYDGKSIDELKKLASDDDECVAFNTWGYFKSKFVFENCIPLENKYNVVDGIYVKRKYLS